MVNHGLAPLHGHLYLPRILLSRRRALRIMLQIVNRRIPLHLARNLGENGLLPGSLQNLIIRRRLLLLLHLLLGWPR